MLSLSMIVRDEAERMEACLRSVQGMVDEMVVVDTGSCDDTVAIARAAGATVHEIPWPGDFAPARNQALQWVRGDWVLVLDADERLSSEAVPSLRTLMAQPDVLVINLLRFEVGSRQAPYSSVSRLFRRHPELHWSRPYHSMVDDSVRALLHQEPHWRIEDCPEPALLHDGYSPERLAGSGKGKRLRQAMEAELRRSPGGSLCQRKAGWSRDGRRPSSASSAVDPRRTCPLPRRAGVCALRAVAARGNGARGRGSCWGSR